MARSVSRRGHRRGTVSPGLGGCELPLAIASLAGGERLERGASPGCPAVLWGAQGYGWALRACRLAEPGEQEHTLPCPSAFPVALCEVSVRRR